MLNEASIRKMMKLANIPSLTDKFIKENFYDYPANEEMVYQRDDEEPMDEPSMDDATMEEPEMDVDVDVEAPAGDDLPAAEELVQDLMGVLEKHFEDIEFNLEVEGGDEEPAMDLGAEPEELPGEPMDDAPVGDGDPAMPDAPMGDEEEPMMETDLEEETIEETDLEEGDETSAGEGDLSMTQSPDASHSAAVAANELSNLEKMEEESLEEEDLEEMEGGDAHNALIDAIAAKVAERLLAEAKKTNE